MDSFLHQQALLSRSRLFIKFVKVVGPALMLIGLVFVGWWRTAYAQQQGIAASPVLADQSFTGIQGYVVGNGPVAAYTCPDTVRCPVKLTLNPGTAVLIVDNVAGGNVPGLNDNAWRKIVYQGLTLFVPLAYIHVGTPGNAPDISLVQTSFEDDSSAAPNYPAGGLSTSTSTITTAPSSSSLPVTCHPLPRPFQCPPPTIVLTCPAGYTLTGNTCVRTVSVIQVGGQVTWYTASDGRINGNAGDRIAIYCRKTGRIEVWSINNSQGHFLVEFNHTAVDAAGSFTVSIGAQGIVIIGSDGHGLYWVDIHGGPFNATGAGDFAKIFRCYVA